jgi:hypothetical protein
LKFEILLKLLYDSKKLFMTITKKDIPNQQLNAIHHGPSPGIVATVFVLLFITGLVVTAIMTHGVPFPIPYGSLEASQKYYLQFADAVRINSFLQFGAAIPLGIFTAAVTSRLKFLGVTATGVNIALFGGIASALFLSLSGLAGWVLSQPGIANDVSTMHAVQLLGFAAGGVAHVTTMGLLLAGVSVTSLFGKYTPKWLAWMGLILAAISELATFGLIVPQAFILLPLARFPSFIWLIGAGFSMSRTEKAL